MTAVWNHLGAGGQLGVACIVTWAVAITGLCAWSWRRHQRAEARRSGDDLAAWENELADGGQR